MKIKNLKLKIYLLICLFAYLFISMPLVRAQSSQNSMYKVQIENINSFADPTTSNNIDIDTSNTGNELSGVNYKVDLGKNYSPENNPFSFSISSTNIDFGSLSPTNPVTRSNILKVKNMNKAGYKVTGIENHELTEAKKGVKIPDTTCDNGKCTDYTSDKWDSTLTYGFGYRCDSSKSSCVENDTSFDRENYFKQFSDASKDETPTTMLSESSSLGQEASITYKVNVSSSQPRGPYSNTVTFIAIPSY